jgi:hypothetical protein
VYCIPWGHEIKLNVQTERESGVSYPDFETEINGDSRSTFDSGPSLVGSFGLSGWSIVLVVPVQEILSRLGPSIVGSVQCTIK